MRAIADRSFALLAAIVVAIFAAMMVLIFVQVVNRYALGYSLFWSEEVVRLLLVWSVMLGTPLVLYRYDEIRVDLLAFSSRRMERMRLLLVLAASAGFCAILGYWGYLFTARALPTQSTTLGISRAWFYAPIPIGAGLAVIALLVRPPAPTEGSAP